jgi:hypothetical protein
LDDVIIRPSRIEVRIKQKSNFGYRTEFIGSGGKVLAKSEEAIAVYELRGGEGYVRAKVQDSGGAVAWVQPVFTQQ